jgi:hypothetical protein
VPVEELLASIDGLRRLCEAPADSPVRPASIPRDVTRPAATDTAGAEDGPPRASPAEKNGQSLLEFIRSRHLPTASILEQGSIEVQADSNVLIEMPAGPFYIEKLKEPATEARLRELCREFFLKDMKVIVKATEKKRREEQPAAAVPDNQQQAVHNPVIQKILETFDGTIVTVRTEP